MLQRSIGLMRCPHGNGLAMRHVPNGGIDPNSFRYHIAATVLARRFPVSPSRRCVPRWANAPDRVQGPLPGSWLVRPEPTAHVGSMFSVDEATAQAIRQAFEESGELSAVVELRRHFPGITDNENARLCVRAIIGWRPLPPRRTTGAPVQIIFGVTTALPIPTIEAGDVQRR